MPIFIGELPEHLSIKQMVLDKISMMPEGEYIGGKSRISKCDYDLPKFFKREYADLVRPCLLKYMLNLGNSIGYNDVQIHNLWFQQYKQDSVHHWHIHYNCQWTNVYYLDLNDNNPKTQILEFLSKEIIDMPIKEGDVLTFPSSIIHRAPPNKHNSVKTIISFNSDFFMEAEDYGQIN